MQIEYIHYIYIQYIHPVPFDSVMPRLENKNNHAFIQHDLMGQLIYQPIFVIVYIPKFIPYKYIACYLRMNEYFPNVINNLCRVYITKFIHYITQS